MEGDFVYVDQDVSFNIRNLLKREAEDLMREAEEKLKDLSELKRQIKFQTSEPADLQSRMKSLEQQLHCIMDKFWKLMEKLEKHEIIDMYGNDGCLERNIRALQDSRAADLTPDYSENGSVKKEPTELAPNLMVVRREAESPLDIGSNTSEGPTVPLFGEVVDSIQDQVQTANQNGAFFGNDTSKETMVTLFGESADSVPTKVQYDSPATVSFSNETSEGTAVISDYELVDSSRNKIHNPCQVEAVVGKKTREGATVIPDFLPVGSSRNRMQNAQEVARSHNGAPERVTNRYELPSLSLEYEDDIVWFPKEAIEDGKGNKPGPACRGPYVVISKQSRLTHTKHLDDGIELETEEHPDWLKWKRGRMYQS